MRKQLLTIGQLDSARSPTLFRTNREHHDARVEESAFRASTKDCRYRASADRWEASAGSVWSCFYRRPIGRRAGYRAVARDFCRHACRRRQRQRFCGDGGAAHREEGRGNRLAAPAGCRGAGRRAACAWPDRDRPRSAPHSVGRDARCAGLAARGGRGGAMCPGRRGGDRTVADAARAGSDGKPPARDIVRDVGGDRADAAGGGGARAQRRPYALAGGIGGVRAAGGQCAGLSRPGDQSFAPAWACGRRTLAGGVGS